MKQKKHFSPVLMLSLLAFLLTGISFISILIFGKSCTLKLRLKEPENFTVEYDKQIVECISQQVKGNLLELEMHSVSVGNTLVTVEEPEQSHEIMLYVHSTGIITLDNFLGKCRGDVMFSASAIIVLAVALLIVLKRYRISVKQSIYRYRNSGLLGLIIFITFILIQHLIGIAMFSTQEENRSILEILEQVSLSGQAFSVFLLPVAVLISVIISISNLILMKREGIGFRNMLGFFLGFCLCFGTLAPFFLYPFLDRLGVNVHNQKSIIVFLENFAEDSISVFVAYLECLLLGTIVFGIKAARHIPAFDKDYILILGCQITKDGKLTKLLQSRTDRAVEFARMQKEHTGKELIFVPSGGKGSDEVIPEAEAIHNYLISIGIPEEKILVENQSANTEQNIKFSYKIINNKKAKIAFSTTNYHVFRAGCLAETIQIPMEGIGAKTKSYFWINAFIREFVAVLNTGRKNHIKMLIMIIITLLPIEFLIYFSFLI